MTRTFNEGDKFTLTDEALENYGQKYADQTFTVAKWFDHYTPSAQVDWSGRTDPHGHPGLDTGAGSALYETDDLPFALYEWEMEAV